MRRVLLLLLVVCGAVYAFADPTEWELVSFSGGDWTNGYPYYVEPLSGPTGSIIAAMCDDYAHGGQPGDIWDANVTNLGSRDISDTRFNRLHGPFALYPLQLYNEAGWILLQTQSEQVSEWKSMNYAVWHIFDPNAPLFGDAQTWIDAAEMAAQGGFQNTDFNKVYIITPTNQYDPDPNSPQEFLYIGQDPTGAQQDKSGGGNHPRAGNPADGGHRCGRIAWQKVLELGPLVVDKKSLPQEVPDAPESKVHLARGSVSSHNWSCTHPRSTLFAPNRRRKGLP